MNNIVADEPTLKDLLDLHKKDILLNANCTHIATVQSFDATKQTVTATINYTKTYYQMDVSSGTYAPYPVSYPVLIDCPVVIVSGGHACLTMPIAQGDECLIFFNDRDFSSWFSSGNTGATPPTPRLHSFSDAIAMVGIRSRPNKVQNYDATRAVLRNGNAAVGVNNSNSKVLVTSNYPTNSTTLNSVLQSLITAIKNITVTVDGVPTPINNISSFTSIGTQIGNLLE